MLEGLGSFRDPAIVPEALALSLKEGLDPRESIRIVFEMSHRSPDAVPAYAFVKDNKTALERRLPGDYAAFSPWAPASVTRRQGPTSWHSSSRGPTVPGRAADPRPGRGKARPLHRRAQGRGPERARVPRKALRARPAPPSP